MKLKDGVRHHGAVALVNLFISVVVTFVIFAVMFTRPSGESLPWYWGALALLAALAWGSARFSPASKWTSLACVYAPMVLFVLFLLPVNLHFEFMTRMVAPLVGVILAQYFTFRWIPKSPCGTD